MVAACCRPGYLCSSGILMVDALVAITAITAMRSWALLQRRWAGMAQWAWGLHGQVQLVPGQVRGLCCTARLSLATCMLRVLGRLSLKKGQNRSYPIYFISMIYIAVLFLSNRVMRIARCYSARSRTSFLHLCPPRWRQEVQQIFSDEFEAFCNIIFIRPHRASQDTLLISMYGKNARVPAAFLQNSS